MKVACAALLALSLAAAEARADPRQVKETLNLVWEVFWQQQGYLQYVSKWTDPIRLKFSGPVSPGERKFTLEALQRVGRMAGIDVWEADAASGPANLEVEIVREYPATGGLYQPCRTTRAAPTGVIRNAKITVEARLLQRCMLHEAMHAFGFAGHPSGGSVLSYYRESFTLTSTDEFMLKVWYSEEVTPRMLPLPALAVFARRLAQTAPAGDARLEAERVAERFVREALEQLESIALGKGEPPRIVFRSSTSTAAGLERGRTEAQFLAGMAYTFGHASAIDTVKGAGFLARAAVSSHREAQVYTGHAYYLGRGVDRDPVEAYKWYALAARQGHPVATRQTGQLEQSLSAEELAVAKSRAANP